jgi:hypothetical protein
MWENIDDASSIYREPYEWALRTAVATAPLKKIEDE